MEENTKTQSLVKNSGHGQGELTKEQMGALIHQLRATLQQMRDNDIHKRIEYIMTVILNEEKFDTEFVKIAKLELQKSLYPYGLEQAYVDLQPEPLPEEIVTE